MIFIFINIIYGITSVKHKTMFKNNLKSSNKLQSVIKEALQTLNSEKSISKMLEPHKRPYSPEEVTVFGFENCLKDKNMETIKTGVPFLEGTYDYIKIPIGIKSICDNNCETDCFKSNFRTFISAFKIPYGWSVHVISHYRSQDFTRHYLSTGTIENPELLKMKPYRKTYFDDVDCLEEIFNRHEMHSITISIMKTPKLKLLNEMKAFINELVKVRQYFIKIKELKVKKSNCKEFAETDQKFIDSETQKGKDLSEEIDKIKKELENSKNELGNIFETKSDKSKAEDHLEIITQGQASKDRQQISKKPSRPSKPGIYTIYLILRKKHL